MTIIKGHQLCLGKRARSIRVPIQLQAAGLTDKGRRRADNEDTIYHKIVPDPDEDATGLFIVADGIGGRLAGEAASYWAVETIKTSLSDLIGYRDPRATHQFDREELLYLHNTPGIDPDNYQDRIVAAVRRANDAVRGYARHLPNEARDAGSTLSMALVKGLQAYVANVGDSRTYLLRDGHLGQITVDHSLVQKLIDEGSVQPAQRYTHPQRNVIYRSLGAADNVEVDTYTVRLNPGDFLLLCSDGLWEMIQSPAEIATIILNAPSLEMACQELVAAANAAGGEDNIGVVLARVLGS
jgi:serine/threonine protein phosphatase PrpC